MGKDSWTQSGKEEHAAGEAEINAAQAKGYAEGTFDRLAGKKDTIIGAMTGDRGQEASGMYSCRSPPTSGIIHRAGNLRHDKGQTKQEINK